MASKTAAGDDGGAVLLPILMVKAFTTPTVVRPSLPEAQYLVSCVLSSCVYARICVVYAGDDVDEGGEALGGRMRCVVGKYEKA